MVKDRKHADVAYEMTRGFGSVENVDEDVFSRAFESAMATRHEHRRLYDLGRAIRAEYDRLIQE